MFKGIPAPALTLGLLGLIPFLLGLAQIYGYDLVPPALRENSRMNLPSTGAGLMLIYGKIVLSFMGGALWGFASGRATWLLLTLSFIPALWAFLVVGGDLVMLAFGFVGLLVIDFLFAQFGLTPKWWMRLRGMLTIVVLICLLAPSLG